MDKNLYYAVNGSGQGCVFTTFPVRDNHFKVWCGDQISCYTMAVSQMESDGLELPALKWSDEPIKIKLSAEICNSDE